MLYSKYNYLYKIKDITNLFKVNAFFISIRISLKFSLVKVASILK